MRSYIALCRAVPRLALRVSLPGWPALFGQVLEDHGDGLALYGDVGSAFAAPDHRVLWKDEDVAASRYCCAASMNVSLMMFGCP